jgi:CDP-diacylglycerol--glycerol-3-phosphate 3-phosphatidyltransferase
MTGLPNMLTSLRLTLVPIFVWMATRGTLTGSVLALAAFVMASITDSLDGYYARKHGTTTDLGIFLDPLADKLLVLSAFYLCALGIGASQSWFNIWLVHLIAVREIVITALRVAHRRKGRQVITAWAGKWKAGMQIGVLCTVLTIEAAARVADALGGPGYWIYSAPAWYLIQTLFAIAVVLTVVSGIRYFTVNHRTMPLADSTEMPEA